MFKVENPKERVAFEEMLGGENIAKKPIKIIVIMEMMTHVITVVLANFSIHFGGEAPKYAIPAIKKETKDNVHKT